MWLLTTCVVLLLAMVNVSNGSFLRNCNKTVTVYSQYQTYDLTSYDDGVHYKDGKKITCDVTFVAGSPDTKLSIKFPSYDIAVDGNTDIDMSYLPGGPHVRDDDGITVYDLLAKEYLLGSRYSRWVGKKGTRFDFSSLSDDQLRSKEYVYYKVDLGQMKDMETAKEFAKTSKVLISYKGEPTKDRFSLKVGLMKESTPDGDSATTVPFLPQLPDNGGTTAAHSCRVLGCENGGTCETLWGESSCSCRPGYTGNRCQYDDSHSCGVLGCENGGTCETLWGETSCACLPGYTGDHCQYDDYGDSATTVPFLPQLPDTDFNQYPDDSSVQYNNGGTTVKNTVLYPIVGVVVFVVLLLSIGLRLYIRSRRIMAAQQNAQRVRSWLFTEFLRAAILRQGTTSEDHDILVANAEGGIEGPTPVNVNRNPTGAMPAPPAYETVVEEGNKFLPPSYEAAMSPVTPQGASAGPVPQSGVAPQATTEPLVNVTTEASVDVTGATQPLVHGPQSNANSDLQQGPIV